MRKRSMSATMTSLRRSGARLLRLTTKLIGTVGVVAKIKPTRKKASKPKAAQKPKSAPAARRAPAFKPNPGALVMHTHVPASLKPGAPLVVLLHGCGQEPERFAAETGWKQLADRGGFVLLMPGQTEANNRQRCFNWFRPADVSRDMGEAASIHAMVRSVLAKHRCDKRRIFVTGLSAGGAMTASLLAGYPDVFAGGAVVAGLPAGAASGMVGAMTRMAGRGAELSAAEWQSRARALAPIAYRGPWPRISIWRGDADTVVAPVNGVQLAAQWVALHGLDTALPPRVARPGVSCQAWNLAGGAPVVELWTLAGVGHVYPTLAMNGVSAAEQIARSWDLSKSFV